MALRGTACRPRRLWRLPILIMFGLMNVVVARGFVHETRRKNSGNRFRGLHSFASSSKDKGEASQQSGHHILSWPKPPQWAFFSRLRRRRVSRNTLSPLSSSSSSSCNEKTATSSETNLATEIHDETTTKKTSSSESKDSVHLQLQSAHGANSVSENKTTTAPAGTDVVNSTNNDSNNNSATNRGINRNSTKTVEVHTFQDTKTRTVWKALNTAKSKFQAFLQYKGVLMMTMMTDSSDAKDPKIDTFKVSMQDPVVSRQVRTEWRELWKKERLITDRTEVLAVYPSETQEEEEPHPNQHVKRGGFSDHLHLYVERLVAILRDERVLATSSSQHALLDWLSRHYGENETQRLIATHFHAMPENKQLAELKKFLEWFRSEFPYYYDRCIHCGASVKEDTAQAAANRETEETESDETDSTPADLHGNDPASDETDIGHGQDEQESEDHSFLGYIYPDEKELLGKASRTELYQCHKCKKFTRFARFNSALHVLESRRGRCGEYSVLLFEFLRALGHEARWVVDWADHVWAEIAIRSDKNGKKQRWVHLDPCEAAVDENLIYEGWGKKQTYILGFYAPDSGDDPSAPSFPLIEDVTRSYTSDKWREICKRRDEPEKHVKTCIELASERLQNQLVEDYHNDKPTR